MQEELLDVALVPAGLLLLLLYHVHLVYLLLFYPLSTVIGVNNSNRKLWVRTMMADGLKNGILAVQTLRNNIMASTLLATAAITLCSVLAILMSSNGSSNLHHNSRLFLGDQRTSTTSVKLLCIFVCFLVAFLCNVQSVRYYSHVSFLINIPLAGASSPGLASEYVNKAMVRGGQFWSLGLRSLYFSLPMFMWFFGPIPMFICSVVLVTLLHFLDTAKEFKKTTSVSSQTDVESVLPS